MVLGILASGPYLVHHHSVVDLCILQASVKGSPEIAAWAKDEYKKLGSMTRSEIFMALISVLALVLWIGASTFKVNPKQQQL